MNKNQKQTVVTSFLMAALMVAQTSAGLIEDLTTYLWNFFIYAQAIKAATGCYSFGGWGLLFDNDEGAMMQQCYDMFGGGANVTFPVEYQMN